MICHICQSNEKQIFQRQQLLSTKILQVHVLFITISAPSSIRVFSLSTLPIFYDSFPCNFVHDKEHLQFTIFVQYVLQDECKHLATPQQFEWTMRCLINSFINCRLQVAQNECNATLFSKLDNGHAESAFSSKQHSRFRLASKVA